MRARTKLYSSSWHGTYRRSNNQLQPARSVPLLAWAFPSRFPRLCRSDEAVKAACLSLIRRSNENRRGCVPPLLTNPPTLHLLATGAFSGEGTADGSPQSPRTPV